VAIPQLALWFKQQQITQW